MVVFALVIATLVFPGVGHVTLGRTLRGCAWAVATIGVLLGGMVTVWALVGWLAIRFAAMIDLIVVRRGTELRYLAGVGLAGATVAAMIAIRLIALEPFGVPTSSMVPTVVPGDGVLVDRLARDPVRGAVIAFIQPCERDRTYLKRAVALGGDRVEIRCQVLYVNGKPDGAAPGGDRGDFPSLHLPFAPRCSNAPEQPAGKLVFAPGTHAPCDRQLEFVVPVDAVFVLGDNRLNSNDSREFGVIPVRDVVGRAVGIYTPARFGDLR